MYSFNFTVMSSYIKVHKNYLPDFPLLFCCIVTAGIWIYIMNLIQ